MTDEEYENRPKKETIIGSIILHTVTEEKTVKGCAFTVIAEGLIDNSDPNIFAT